MRNSGAKGLLVIALTINLSVASAQYKLYEKGFENYKAGKFDQAITSFTEFLNKPTREKSLDVEVYYLRGLSYFKTENHKNAVGDFQDAILLNHTNKGNIFWFLALSNEKLGYYYESVDAYDNAIKALQSNKETLVKLLYERSKIFQKLDKKVLAYNDLQRAFTIQPGNETIRKELEKFDKNEMETLTAEQTAQRVVSIPDQSSIANQLVELYKDEKRYALVIGNSQYSREIGELRNPVNDATDMAAELEKSNFDVQLLTNATYGQIRAGLLKFKEKLDAGDRDKTVGLFYFAGHGLRLEEENYIVPVDAKIEYEDDIWRYCFPVQRMVLSNMEQSNTRLNIVILDACRNNPFPSLTRSIGQQGLAEMQKARGSFIAYATAPGSVAIDGTGRNGLYTQEILKAIRKPGRTIEQVFKEVRLNVLRISEEKQNTWDSSNIVGEFYFKF
ncbi:MAG: caspase family protein [Cyclobacteriaceae bacterium]